MPTRFFRPRRTIVILAAIALAILAAPVSDGTVKLDNSSPFIGGDRSFDNASGCCVDGDGNCSVCWH